MRPIAWMAADISELSRGYCLRQCTTPVLYMTGVWLSQVVFTLEASQRDGLEVNASIRRRPAVSVCENTYLTFKIGYGKRGRRDTWVPRQYCAGLAPSMCGRSWSGIDNCGDAAVSGIGPSVIVLVQRRVGPG